jgi:hypothetical protein
MLAPNPSRLITSFMQDNEHVARFPPDRRTKDVVDGILDKSVSDTRQR